MPRQPGLQGVCRWAKIGALSLAVLVAGGVVAVMAAAGSISGTTEAVALNLGAFVFVGALLVVAHRCEVYVSTDGRRATAMRTATDKRSALAPEALAPPVPEGGPVALVPLGLPPIAAVVGAGIDPATSHFSGARSTN